MSNFAFLQELLNTVADQSRNILPKALFRDDPRQGLQELVKALMSGRGEASGVAIAHQLLRHYDVLDPEMKLVFFNYVAEALQPDQSEVAKAAASYIAEPSASHLRHLQRSVDSPTQEFFRRLNMAPGGTAKIVAMREDLHGFMEAEPDNDRLKTIDNDLRHLLQSWFNRGFLVQRRIDWNTPATILDKIIAYEAVHEITGWDDLRRRLDPADRRCFAFFHPSMVDEPLIFVQVALTSDIPADIAGVLEMEPPDSEDGSRGPTTAAFYSISNCQEGLRGISFGNFLIKQVVEELTRECPSLRTFVTLSPVPGFAKWVDSIGQDETENPLDERMRAAITAVKVGDWIGDETAIAALAPSVQALGAMYFLNEKNARGQPIDPVARFHLGNGARLERINWPADLSLRGLKQAHGLMVNYLYELSDIEKNHEAYANDQVVAASRAVRGLLRGRARQRDLAAVERADIREETVPALVDESTDEQPAVSGSEQ
ncbi:MAG: malonyl-CoA decarboxylase [Hyphomicrobiaceae bacterium]